MLPGLCTSTGHYFRSPNLHLWIPSYHIPLYASAMAPNQHHPENGEYLRDVATTHPANRNIAKETFQ
jgi:hypothetical protein